MNYSLQIADSGVLGG